MIIKDGPSHNSSSLDALNQHRPVLSESESKALSSEMSQVTQSFIGSSKVGQFSDAPQPQSTVLPNASFIPKESEGAVSKLVKTVLAFPHDQASDLSMSTPDKSASNDQCVTQKEEGTHSDSLSEDDKETIQNTLLETERQANAKESTGPVHSASEQSSQPASLRHEMASVHRNKTDSLVSQVASTVLSSSKASGSPKPTSTELTSADQTNVTSKAESKEPQLKQVKIETVDLGQLDQRALGLNSRVSIQSMEPVPRSQQIQIIAHHLSQYLMAQPTNTEVAHQLRIPLNIPGGGELIAQLKGSSLMLDVRGGPEAAAWMAMNISALQAKLKHLGFTINWVQGTSFEPYTMGEMRFTTPHTLMAQMGRRKNTPGSNQKPLDEDS